MPTRRTLPKNFDYTRWLVERERCQLDQYMPAPPFKEAEMVGEGLDKVLKKIGVSFSADENQIQSEWIQIVGKDLAKHTMPGSLERKTLSVFVMGAAWFAELKRAGTENLVKKINAYCGDGTVKNINFQPAPSGYKS